MNTSECFQVSDPFKLPLMVGLMPIEEIVLRQAIIPDLRSLATEKDILQAFYVGWTSGDREKIPELVALSLKYFFPGVIQKIIPGIEVNGKILFNCVYEQSKWLVLQNSTASNDISSECFVLEPTYTDTNLTSQETIEKYMEYSLIVGSQIIKKNFYGKYMLKSIDYIWKEFCKNKYKFNSYAKNIGLPPPLNDIDEYISKMKVKITPMILLLFYEYIQSSSNSITP